MKMFAIWAVPLIGVFAEIAFAGEPAEPMIGKIISFSQTQLTLNMGSGRICKVPAHALGGKPPLRHGQTVVVRVRRSQLSCLDRKIAGYGNSR